MRRWSNLGEAARKGAEGRAGWTASERKAPTLPPARRSDAACTKFRAHTARASATHHPQTRRHSGANSGACVPKKGVGVRKSTFSFSSAAFPASASPFATSSSDATIRCASSVRPCEGSGGGSGVSLHSGR